MNILITDKNIEQLPRQLVDLVDKIISKGRIVKNRQGECDSQEDKEEG